MPTATLPQVWRGRSGREYVPLGKTRLRHGGMATVRKVVGRDAPVGTSTVEPDVPLALKLWREGDEASLDQLQQEARILVELGTREGELPCPRLVDLVGEPLVTGLVMEWCPADLERWWRSRLAEPDAFGRLTAAMAEAARRTSDYHGFFDDRQGLEGVHGDLKPANILLSAQGRWLISDFGAAVLPLPEEGLWDEERDVVATDNFVAPEVLFHARCRFPAAVDAWSLGATFFALLRLRRMTEDGSPVPRDGTSSARFRMERVHRVFQTYAVDPRRFRDRDLDPEAFLEPLQIPEEDRRVVRDSLLGVFGPLADGDRREEELTQQVLALLDRAMSIDPAHRFTDCRDLAAAFEQLTRTYLALSATEATPEPAPRSDDGGLKRALELEERRNRRLQRRLQQLEAEVAHQRTSPVSSEGDRPHPVWEPPLWWSVSLILVLVLQALTVLALAVLVVLSWPGGGW